MPLSPRAGHGSVRAGEGPRDSSCQDRRAYERDASACRDVQSTPPTAGLFSPGHKPQIDAASATYYASMRVHPVHLSHSPVSLAPLWRARPGNRPRLRFLSVLDNDVVQNASIRPLLGPANEAQVAADSRTEPAWPDRTGPRDWGSTFFHSQLLEFLFKAEYAYDTECHSGSPGWTLVSIPTIERLLALAVTNRFTFACGIAMSWQTMSGCPVRQPIGWHGLRRAQDRPKYR